MSPVTRHLSLVFLLGFMGSGKSTVGRALAKALHVDFADTDTLVEQRCKLSVEEIFSKEGEETFRRYEREVVQDLFGREKLVVACGGGLPCFFDNMEQLNAHGVTVYLEATPEFLAERLETQHLQHRPLLQKKTGEALKQHIAQMLAQREPYYQQALITVDASQEELLHDLLARLDVLDA